MTVKGPFVSCQNRNVSTNKRGFDCYQCFSDFREETSSRVTTVRALLVDMDFLAIQLDYSLRLGEDVDENEPSDVHLEYPRHPNADDFRRIEVYGVDTNEAPVNEDSYDLIAIQTLWLTWYQIFQKRFALLVDRLVGSIVDVTEWVVVIEELQGLPSRPGLKGTFADAPQQQTQDYCRAIVHCDWLIFETNANSIWHSFAWFLQPLPKGFAWAGDLQYKGDQSDPQVVKARKLREAVSSATRGQLIHEIVRLLPKKFETAQINTWEQQINERLAAAAMDEHIAHFDRLNILG